MFTREILRDPKSKRDVIAYHYRPRDDIRGDANSVLGLNYLDFSSVSAPSLYSEVIVLMPRIRA
jgi:hypothetical protein